MDTFFDLRLEIFLILTMFSSILVDFKRVRTYFLKLASSGSCLPIMSPIYLGLIFGDIGNEKMLSLLITLLGLGMFLVNYLAAMSLLAENGDKS
ncbi:hypothetical protein CS022_20290 [Veronia nyctiphanis]|uniref:Uncharacterized protein n=1 Tax=Veronia nyctiphanis TaxID=1278244 RepID=A0A4Q0YLN6_9GAMM|nr:hypothetical protein [Veronia nyctiphanis]RXJ71680.1 hypothetical protein CS022_20290 [Veronia nyctiphanis]